LLHRRQRNNSGRCVAVKHRCIFSKRRTLRGCSTKGSSDRLPLVYAVLRDEASFTDHVPGMSRPAGRAMQFPTEMHLMARGRASFSAPGEATTEREFARVPEIGSSAGFLDKRDARSSARTSLRISRGQVTPGKYGYKTNYDN
jgi:hypothetical protein